jgi:hypothetical protein
MDGFRWLVKLLDKARGTTVARPGTTVTFTVPHFSDADRDRLRTMGVSGQGPATTGTMRRMADVDDDNVATADGLSPAERQALNAAGRHLGGCLRCHDRWNWKRPHYTREIGTRCSCFPLCEQCYQELETPAARWPFYEALAYQWAAEGYPPEPGTLMRMWQGLHVEHGLPVAEPPPAAVRQAEPRSVVR